MAIIRDTFIKRMTWLLICFCSFLTVLINYKYYQLPLNLDETNTFYLSSLPVTDLIKQVYFVQHHSPLHFIITKFSYLFAQGFLPFEAALRLPSLVFNLLTAFFIFRIVKFFTSAQSATITLLFAFTSVSFLNIVFQARPYALMFMLACYLTWLIVSYTGGKAFWLKFILANILLVFTHYLAVQFFLFELLLTTVLFKSKSLSLRVAAVLTLSGSSAILCLPQLAMISNKSEVLVIAQMPGFQLFLKRIFYPELLIFSPLAIWTFLRPKDFKMTAQTPLFTLAFLMLGSLGTSMLLLSSLTSGSFFLPRYLILFFLANLLIFAAILGSCRLPLLRPIICSVILLSAYNLARHFDALVPPKPWAAISELINTNHLLGDCLVLNIAGYVESVRFDLLRDEKFQSYFKSNYVAYPVSNKIVNLPIAYAKFDEQKLKSLLVGTIEEFKPECIVMPQIRKSIGATTFFGYEITGHKIAKELNRLDYQLKQNFHTVQRQVAHYKRAEL